MTTARFLATPGLLPAVVGQGRVDDRFACAVRVAPTATVGTADLGLCLRVPRL